MLFDGDDVVVHRLAAGKGGDLGVGADRLKHLGGAGGIILGDTLAGVDGDELGVLIGGYVSQPIQQHVQAAAGAQELAVAQGRLVALRDADAAEVGGAGGVGD